MRIILADPPIGEIKDKNIENIMEYPNIGILYLISFLRSKIEGLEIHYLTGKLTLAEHLAEVDRLQPDLYGLSFASTYAALAYETMNSLRRAHPALKMVCGGAHPTAAPEEVLEKSAADGCCLGEGEETLTELVRYYLTGEGGLAQITGIAYRENGQIRRTPRRPYLMNLDEIPFPAWDYIKFEDYVGCRKYKGFPSTALISSRGCPFNCTFCSNPVWKLQKPWIRNRSPKNIAEEVEYLYQRGVREVFIRADEINPDHDWAVAVFKALQALGHADLYFQCNLKAKPVTDELAENMSKANCWAVHLGIESANQRVLDGIKKVIELKDIEHSCRMMKKHKIKVFAFCMLYQVWEDKGQLQVETPREVHNSLAFMLKLRLQNLINFMSWTIATPYPGSQLYDLAEKYQLRIPSPDGQKVIHNYEISMNLPGISKRQIRLSRAEGLLLQGLFVLISKEFYGRKSIGANLRHAVKRLKFIVRPS